MRGLGLGGGGGATFFAFSGGGVEMAWGVTCRGGVLGAKAIAMGNAKNMGREVQQRHYTCRQSYKVATHKHKKTYTFTQWQTMNLTPLHFFHAVNHAEEK